MAHWEFLIECGQIAIAGETRTKTRFCPDTMTPGVDWACGVQPNFRPAWLYSPHTGGFEYKSTEIAWKTDPSLNEAGSRVEWRAGVPLALPMMLLLIPGAAASRIAMRRRRRVDANRCATCGYDVRASRDRCPECGTPVNTDVEASRSSCVKDGVGSNGPFAVTAPVTRAR